MRFGPDDVLYVAERDAGRIITLRDSNGDGIAESSRVFADRLDNPHSLVFHEGSWYVGVPRGIVRLADRDGDGKAEYREVSIDNYPTSGHSTRTVEFLPDGRMVVSVGSSCSACVEDDPRRATVLIYDVPDAKGEKFSPKACATQSALQSTLRPGSYGPPTTTVTGSVTTSRRMRFISCGTAWITAGRVATTAPLSTLN